MRNRIFHTIILLVVFSTSVLAQNTPEDWFYKGVAYYNNKNYDEAAKWFKKAAEQRLKEAQYNLGVMYEKGQGVSKNYTEAVKWYREAAVQRYAPAQYNLGCMYQNGKGVGKNYAEAVKWYKKAADQGLDDYGSVIVGMHYGFGDAGLSKNLDEAIRYINKAINSGRLNEMELAMAKSYLEEFQEEKQKSAQNNTNKTVQPVQQNQQPVQQQQSTDYTPSRTYHRSSYYHDDSNHLGIVLGYVQKQWKVKENGVSESFGWWEGDKVVSGGQFGLQYNPPLGKVLGLNTGIFYEYYYSADDEQALQDDYGHWVGCKGEFEEHNIYVPLHLELNARFNRDWHIFAFGGAAMNFVVSASEKYTAHSSGYEPVKISDIYKEYDYKKFSAALEFGGGIQYKCVQLRYTYSMGLTSMYDYDGLKMYQNKPISIALSVQF